MTEGELKLLLYNIASHPDYLKYSGPAKVAPIVNDVKNRLSELLNQVAVKQGLFTKEAIFCIANKFTYADMDVRLIICRLLVYVCFDAALVESHILNPSIIRILFSDYDIFIQAYKDLISLKHMYTADQHDERMRNEKSIFCAMLDLSYLKIKYAVALAATSAVHAAGSAILAAKSAARSVQYQQQLKFNLLLKNYRLCFYLIPPCPVRNDLPPKPQCSSQNSTLVGAVYLRARVRCALTPGQFAISSVIDVAGMCDHAVVQYARLSRCPVLSKTVCNFDTSHLSFRFVNNARSYVVANCFYWKTVSVLATTQDNLSNLRIMPPVETAALCAAGLMRRQPVGQSYTLARESLSASTQPRLGGRDGF